MSSTNPTEYGSVQLVLDHLLKEHMRSGRNEIVQKMVMSTENIDESLLSLVKYYGMAEVLLDTQSLEILRRAAVEPDAIYLLVTPEGVQVVVSYETWERMAFDEQWGGTSYLNSTVKLIEAVGRYLNAPISQLPTLSMISFAAEKPEEEPEQVRLYTQDEVDALLAESTHAAAKPSRKPKS